MAKCLVLGANGFIASHIVDELADAGHFVRCFDRYKTGEIIFANLKHHDIELFTGDFLNQASLEDAVKGMDYVFHFISTTTPITSENDPLIDIETNIRMSVELFKICSRNKVKRVIFASTGGAVYGNIPTTNPVNEEQYPKPVSPYAIGKLTIENYLRYFHAKHGLEYFVMRISNPFGPRQNTLGGQGVIPIFLEMVSKNEPITIFGDGTMIRDYMYVEDVARLISGVFTSKKNSGIYNIGSGKGKSINEIVSVIERITGARVNKKNVDKPSTFIDHIVLDMTKFNSDFGIKPSFTFEEGIHKTWQSIRNG